MVDYWVVGTTSHACSGWGAHTGRAYSSQESIFMLSHQRLAAKQEAKASF